MNKEQAVEVMAALVYERVIKKTKYDSKNSYKEVCSDLYDAMKEQAIIA
jgi:hypothetical protein